MGILPIPSSEALITRAVKTLETTAFKHANQRHLLHYIVKGLGDLPTSALEQLNQYLNAPTAAQYPHADAHMRLIIGLNDKLKPPIQITQLLQLRQKFATEMVAFQSPSVWQQTNTDEHLKIDIIKNKLSKNKVSNNRKIFNINANENGNTVQWQDKIIANADGGDMIIRCYQAKNNHAHNGDELSGDEPNADNVVMLFFHGGGFCLGDVNTDQEFCHVVCAQTGWAVVSVDYRLAPEHPAPTAIRDSLEAYSWLTKHAHILGASSSRIVLTGDSSGGGLAALVAQQVSNATVGQPSDKQEDNNTLNDFSVDIFEQLQNLPRPLAQLLLYPITDIGTDYPSWKLYGQGLILNYNDIAVFHAAYLQDSSLTQPHALISPISGDNTQICPSYIVAAELDILRDEALVYAKQLQGYGIKVQTHTMLGAPHGFTHLMSVHQGIGREMIHIIDEFTNFVRQIIAT
ncbi:alpha/beta hydrolase [Psychrobacter urativorans]|uniref:Lipase n=1 Tax=Psychrobacter urativorans TaxID=45610 RepID=A0A0M5TIS9_9GAMM|nr:alpha/beta hydrolase [Psychrobacter urativorans]ALF59700.1 lipase [Psychrobacter urativorans]